MIHYTLNTGHSRRSPRSEVAYATIAALDPLLSQGRHPLPIPGAYEAEVTPDGNGVMVTVWSGDFPLATFGVAPDDESAVTLWPEIERLYLQLTDQAIMRSADFEPPRRPSRTPWISAIVIGADPEAAYWIGDFERCFAWAWLEKLKPREPK